MVTRFSCVAMMFFKTCCAVESVNGVPVSAAKAISRVSAPSSSRTLDLIARAMNSATSSGKFQRSFSAFFLQDGDFGLEIRRSNICNKPPLEPRSQALFDGRNVLRQAVGRDHDLFLLLVERVECMEELLLRALLAGNELDVVHQEHVHRVKAIAETDHAVEAQRIDHLDGEFFGADVGQPYGRVALLDHVT